MSSLRRVFGQPSFQHCPNEQKITFLLQKIAPPDGKYLAPKDSAHRDREAV